MKTKLYFLLVVFLSTFLCIVGCGEEEFIGQPSSDSIPPGPISNVQSEGTPGGAIITYCIPTDEDFSHV